MFDNYRKSSFVFLDRDGVLNEDEGHVHKPEDLRILPNVVNGLLELKSLDFKFIIITNQAGIAKGIYREKDLHKFMQALLEMLATFEIHIEDYYFCPHHPQGKISKFRTFCNCRKPMPGMINKACKDHNVNLESSILIGDKFSDIEAGRLAGLGKLFKVDHTQESSGKKDFSYPYIIVKDILEVAEYLKTNEIIE